MIFKSVRPEGHGPEAADFERESISHLDTLYSYAFVFAADANQAEGWLSDAILQAHRRWSDRDPDVDVRAWLLTILRNVVKSSLHQNGGAVSKVPADSPDYTPIPEIHDSDPRGDFFKVLRSDEILGALNRVPHEFAEVVVLRDIEGLNYAEIAEITDADIGTIKSRIFRGRQLLQQDLYRSALEMGFRPKAASATER